MKMANIGQIMLYNFFVASGMPASRGLLFPVVMTQYHF